MILHHTVFGYGFLSGGRRSRGSTTLSSPTLRSSLTVHDTLRSFGRSTVVIKRIDIDLGKPTLFLTLLLMSKNWRSQQNWALWWQWFWHPNFGMSRHRYLDNLRTTVDDGRGSTFTSGPVWSWWTIVASPIAIFTHNLGLLNHWCQFRPGQDTKSSFHDYLFHRCWVWSYQDLNQKVWLKYVRKFSFKDVAYGIH